VALPIAFAPHRVDRPRVAAPEHTNRRLATLRPVGYRGKTIEQQRARELRAEAWTLQEIAEELGVSRSSVSVWARDVVFEPKPRHRPLFRNPSSLHLKKLAEIDEMNDWGREQIGQLTDAAFLAAGAALYAGEGSKGDGEIVFANTDPAMVAFFCRWLRCYFEIDESRLRVRVYLHVGLDLDAAHAFWSEVTGVPVAQFRQGYRAPADPTIRHNKHEYGCVYVRYSCASTHRRIMGLTRALLSS
jgi:transcriptional regulator with XRE-family HTH domain